MKFMDLSRDRLLKNALDTAFLKHMIELADNEIKNHGGVAGFVKVPIEDANRLNAIFGEGIFLHNRKFHVFNAGQLRERAQQVYDHLSIEVATGMAGAFRPKR